MKEININNSYIHSFEDMDVPDGNSTKIIEKKGYLLGRFGNGLDVNRLGLFSENKYSAQDNPEGLNISFEVDSTKIFNSSGSDITSHFQFDSNGKQTKDVNNGSPLILRLVELDYCDTNGNEKKILVLASSPYDKED
jgi:hypothetical protein